MPVSSHGRVPRARIDPIFSATDAMVVFTAQMMRPLRAETLVMFLDDAWRGSSLVTITGTDDPFEIIEIAETMALAGLPARTSTVWCSPACAPAGPSFPATTSSGSRPPMSPRMSAWSSSTG